jgi:CelD/BcsL family acetyltransferase involved in cellulose biosynthesis
MNVAIAPKSITAAALRVEWRPLAAMDAALSAWRALAARALEPNVFYEPAFARAAEPVFGEDVGVGLVWLHDKLIGFFPGRIERRYLVPPAVLTGWTHPYAPLGTPLIDRDDGAAALSAWLDHMTQDAALPGLWLLPFLPDGPFARTLDAALAVRNGRSARFGGHRRALLAPKERADYLTRSLGAKKRKELRRQRHRLEHAGTLLTDITTEASAISGALADFLALEAHGWKGRAGSAARAHPPIRRFMAAAVSTLAAEGKARVDRLVLAGRPIAASVTLRSGNAAWAWKIAYDEAHARASPGVQLMHDLTESLLADTTIARVDSCATADHPMIDHMWRERLALADRLIAVRPARMAFAAACYLETLRRDAHDAAKSLRSRLRGR